FSSTMEFIRRVIMARFFVCYCEECGGAQPTCGVAIQWERGCAWSGRSLDGALPRGMTMEESIVLFLLIYHRSECSEVKRSGESIV
ncbi:MAG: hypothetical protein NC218_12365, partial [Acetobacter sp.]|nr:hypothetical protein [Acetobacter sp.]